MLAVDCGNTRIKWARFDGTKQGEVGRAGLRDATDPYAAFEAALAPDVDRVLVANVAGSSAAEKISDTVESKLGFVPQFVSVAAKAFGIECAYRDPSTFGVDRWLGLIAVRRSVSGPFALVSAGTAVTFDAVDRDGRHLGGLILPGQRLMTGALANNTGQIPPVPETSAALGRGLELLGRSTAEAVGSGTRLALVAAIERAIESVAAALGTSVPLILTGGDAGVLARSLSSAVEIRADLVLEGLARVAGESG